jgi:hypothetical protein
MLTPIDLIRQLDGMTIEDADLLLRTTISLLPRLQVVSKDCLLLNEAQSATSASLQNSPSLGTHDHQQT